MSAPASIIDIQGSVGSGGEFADYSSLTNIGDAFGPSTVVDGSMTLSADGELPVSWSTGQSGGTTYVAGSEINYQLGTVNSVSGAAFANDAYISIFLSSAGSAFDWNSVSVSLWRNGGGAPSTFQWAYSADDNWNALDFLGSPTTVSTTGATGGVPNQIATISFSAADIATSITSGEVRLYSWGNSSANGNTHLINVEAGYTAVPEPGLTALLLGATGCLMWMRRKR